jgi:ryanodine receptor 2
MNAILGFKNLPEEERENCPCNEELAQIQTTFHESFTSKLLHKMAEEELVEEEPVKEETKPGLMNRMMNVVTLAKKHEEEQVAEENVKSREQIFRKVLIRTIISWAEESVSRIVSHAQNFNSFIQKLFLLCR